LVNHLSLVPRKHQAASLADAQHAPASFWPSPIAQRAAERVTVALVARVQERVLASGSRFVILLHPDQPTFERRSSLADRLQTALAERGVRSVVSMAEAYHRWPYTW